MWEVSSSGSRLLELLDQLVPGRVQCPRSGSGAGKQEQGGGESAEAAARCSQFLTLVKMILGVMLTVEDDYLLLII